MAEWLMNDEFGRIWKEPILTSSNNYHEIFLGGTEDIHDKHNPVKIWTRNLSNTIVGRWGYMGRLLNLYIGKTKH
jgi:hypothetical protein